MLRKLALSCLLLFLLLSPNVGMLGWGCLEEGGGCLITVGGGFCWTDGADGNGGSAGDTPIVINDESVPDGGTVTIGPGGVLHFNLSGATGNGIPPFQVEILDVSGTVVFTSSNLIFDWTPPAAGGTFYIRLIDARGLWVQWTIVIQVTVVNPPPPDDVQPVAQITSPPNNSAYAINEAIEFTAVVTQGAPEFKYHWLFPDGSIVDVTSPSTSSSVSKSFSLPIDSGQVYLEVTDQSGLKSEIQTVRVIVN